MCVSRTDKPPPLSISPYVIGGQLVETTKRTTVKFSASSLNTTVITAVLYDRPVH